MKLRCLAYEQLWGQGIQGEFAWLPARLGSRENTTLGFSGPLGSFQAWQ